MSKDILTSHEGSNVIPEMIPGVLYMSTDGWGIRFIGDQAGAISFANAKSGEPFENRGYFAYDPKQDRIHGQQVPASTQTGISYGVAHPQEVNGKALYSEHTVGVNTGTGESLLFKAPDSLINPLPPLFEVEGGVGKKSTRKTIYIIGPVSENDKWVYIPTEVTVSMKPGFKRNNRVWLPSTKTISSPPETEAPEAPPRVQHNYQGTAFYQKDTPDPGWPDNELWPNPKEQNTPPIVLRREEI